MVILFDCIVQNVAIQVGEQIRAFLGIDITDKSLFPLITETQEHLDPAGAKMKLVEIENIHFTLRFFGDTPVSRVDEIESCLRRIRFEPFEIQVKGVGAFPNKHKPRVIWIGATMNAQRIQALKREIDSNLEELGYTPEKKRFTPHATIARVRHIKDRQIISSNIENLAEKSIGPMTVSHFSMKKSTLTPSGPIYDTLWQIP